MAIDFPDSPSNNDIYTVNGKRWIYSSGKWSIYGSTAPDATASDTEPTGVGDGHIWYRSDQSQTLIRYDNTWVEVGSAGGFDNASTNFPTSLDSATGFAAVEALQAKVGADSSAVTTSLDYKVSDHASRLTTLEGAPGSGLVLVSRTTIGSGVSTVTVSNAFSADYDNYIVVLSGGAHSSGAALYARLGGFTTGYCYGGIEYNYSGTSSANSNSNAGFFKIGNADPDGNFGYAIIQNPYSTKLTAFTTSWAGSVTSGSSKQTVGFLDNTSSITSIEVFPNTGTFNGGYVDVYGYAKA